MSVADELRKLADLKEEGLLTEAEFQAEKTRLLSADDDPHLDTEHHEEPIVLTHKGMSLGAKILLIIAGLVVAFLGFGYIQSEKDGARAKSMGHSLTEYQAFGKCEAIIRSMSKNPSSAKIPRAHGSLRGDIYYFKWSPADMQLQNGFGAMIGASGDCSINAVTGRLDNISLN